MKEKEINEPNSTDMNRKGIVTAFLLAAGLLAGREAQAQRTYEEMEQLTVNERVTMVVTVSEPVRPADISTDKESLPRERKAYNNSAVSMSTAEMTRYASCIIYANCVQFYFVTDSLHVYECKIAQEGAMH